MAVKMSPETERYLLGSIRRFFAEELDEDIGDLKARIVLEFCVREIGPSIYNQAIADAQRFLERAAADLSGDHFQAEFDYWKKR